MFVEQLSSFFCILCIHLKESEISNVVMSNGKFEQVFVFVVFGLYFFKIINCCLFYSQVPIWIINISSVLFRIYYLTNSINPLNYDK